MSIGPGSIVGGGEVKLISLLGLGGFGEVFLAQTPAGLRALKVVDTSAWSESEYQVFNALFMTEASYLRTLDHPLLPKSEGFFAEGKRYFLLMDWVKGRTLEEWVRRDGPLGFDDFFELLGALIDVLTYLHRQCPGVVVFGDLKPANVLRTSDDGYRLVDLGLVSKKGSKLTGKFAVFSPNYSAPERRRGAASDPSQDIYSLGATSFFALTSKEPALGASARELQRAMTERLKAESEGWGEASLHCLKKLLTLLLAALDPDPGGRPSGVRIFAQAWARTKEALKLEQGGEQQDVSEIFRILYEGK